MSTNESFDLSNESTICSFEREFDPSVSRAVSSNLPSCTATRIYNKFLGQALDGIEMSDGTTEHFQLDPPISVVAAGTDRMSVENPAVPAKTPAFETCWV